MSNDWLSLVCVSFSCLEKFIDISLWFISKSEWTTLKRQWAELLRLMTQLAGEKVAVFLFWPYPWEERQSEKCNILSNILLLCQPRLTVFLHLAMSFHFTGLISKSEYYKCGIRSLYHGVTLPLVRRYQRDAVHMLQSTIVSLQVVRWTLGFPLGWCQSLRWTLHSGRLPQNTADSRLDGRR